MERIMCGAGAAGGTSEGSGCRHGRLRSGPGRLGRPPEAEGRLLRRCGAQLKQIRLDEG